MFPSLWFWLWAPQIHWGTFEPRTNTKTDTELFFWGAGNPKVEKRALGKASYGRQLGWITDVLLAQQGKLPDDAAKASLEELVNLHKEIEIIKKPGEAALAVRRIARPRGPKPNTEPAPPQSA